MEITAPFDGFITKVNVEGGDEAKKGTVAVQIADPDKFEAEIMVGEMDILQLKLGADASVQVDAMPGVNLPAKVTHISPTATIQSGVVNYVVKVELQSLQAVPQERQEAGQGTMQKMQPGELPPRLKQAIEEGRITREQVEQIMKQQRQEQGGQRQGQSPSAVPENFQLREGLTVTVSILVTTVQVLKNGVSEPRAITTGISNWTHTEVTDGLSEGEEVIISQATTSTQSSSSSSRTPFLPGMRRPR